MLLLSKTTSALLLAAHTGKVALNRKHPCLVDPALCVQKDISYRKDVVIELTNNFQVLTITQDGLALLTRDEC